MHSDTLQRNEKSFITNDYYSDTLQPNEKMSSFLPLKLIYSQKATTIWWKLQKKNWYYLVSSKKVGDFVKFVWPSQNKLTLFI